MPVNIRVDVPDFKAEVDLSCELHNASFWHLKLCLVDGLLSLYKNAPALKKAPPPPPTVDHEKRPLMRLVANTLRGRTQDNSRSSNGHFKSCMLTPAISTTTTRSSTNSIVSAVRRAQRRHNSVVSSSRCHSSASSSLSLSDNSSSSHAFETSNTSATTTTTLAARSSCLIFGRSQSQNEASKSSLRESSPSACYYGFGGVSLTDWADDNARQSNELSDEEEDAAVRAIVMATTSDPDCFRYARSDGMSTNGNYNECTSSSTTGSHFNDDSCNSNSRQIRDLLELDERDESNVYECLRFGTEKASELSADDVYCETTSCCDRTDNELDIRSTEAAAAHSRLFEQLLDSGFLNYGFYSFSLGKFINDQTSLTEYLTLVSSSTGASYYLDLEFKLKRRQQASSSLLRSGIYTTASASSSICNGLSLNGRIRANNDATSLKSNRSTTTHNLSFNSLNGRMKRSISNCSNESHQTILQPKQQTLQQPSFTTNNMIAKLASSSNGASSHKAASSNGSQAMSSSLAASPSASQSKRKRSKLLDLLLNTNWSKQSQQAANLMKLNKALLVCDANFLDEKSGESPLSLVITSPQINETQAPTTKTSRLKSVGSGSSAQLTSSTIGCPQSTSLFDLQSQHPTTSHNLLTLHQNSAVEISQSKAPLVERILLLLVKSGALVDFRNNDGRTPLHVAAKVSNFWALKTLLDLEASPAAIDINGLTPLFYSILHKAELKVTQLLLNHMNNSNRNSSSLSFPNGHVADGLVVAGSSCMEIIDQHGWQAIHYAAKYGLSGHLEKLLYYGCDINAKIRGSGNTPLHVAAINDQLQVAKVLLLRGADKTITNNSHQTAHQVAVISNNMNLAEFIASHDVTKVVPFNNPRPSVRHLNGSDKTNQTIDDSRRLSMCSLVSHQTQAANNTNASTTNNSISNNQPFAQQQSSSIALNSAMQLAALQERHIEQNQQPPASHLQQEPMHSNHHQQQQLQQRLNPLTLDVANDYVTSAPSSAPTTNTSGTSHQTAPSLLSIDSSSQLHQNHHQGNNISPCLSQRSCGTSNTATTSSSGVCCDAGDGSSSNSHQMDNSKSRQSNITIISIGNNNGRETCNVNAISSVNNQQTSNNQQQQQCLNDTSFPPALSKFATGNNNASELASENSGFVNDHQQHHQNHQQQQQQQQAPDEGINGQEEGEENLSDSESSSDELYSLMSDRKPLFVGSKVKATNCYESGDPKHLQLRRDDLVEILECPVELIQDGQLPRLANKPMLYGRRQSDGVCGLFPSFCVRRTKQKLTPGPRRPIQDVTNLLSRGHTANLIAGPTTTTTRVATTTNGQLLPSVGQKTAIRGSNLPESQSMASMGANLHLQQQGLSTKTATGATSETTTATNTASQRNEFLPSFPPPPAQAAAAVSFKEFQVTLNKVNDGFGFVLRGARIDPSTISNQENVAAGTLGKISIDERLMAANKLASLQYFSDIEPNSIAHQNGLKRGDFLVSVNNHDVRMCSHEQVVQMIRQSGDKVYLTIARTAPLISGSSKTLSRVKPEPPKRDPATTLTRNKTMRVKSMYVAPQVQQQLNNYPFDADKPLPNTPQNDMMVSSSSPVVGLTMNRSVSTNLSHFSSVNSLSSGALDAQSISSISTLNSIQAPDSSSSTATLTTVATNKPKVAPKYDVTNHSKASFGPNNSSNNKSLYQPASLITTTTNNNNKPQSSVAAPVPVQEVPSNNIAVSSSQRNSKPSEIPIPPPPPPPPLPDFLLTPTKDRLNQRRTSAPINQAAPLIQIDKNLLMKKRESLAVVSSDSPSATGAPPAPICAVAAACAAAANSRLQRQQQQQQQQQQQEVHTSNQEAGSGGKVSQAPLEHGLDSSALTPTNNPRKDAANPIRMENTNKEPELATAAAAGPTRQMINDPPKTQHHATTAQAHVREMSGFRSTTHSATLGRKSSAQIIQEPKQNTIMSHSQTLKISSGKQRMSILDYDSQIFVEQKRPIDDRQRTMTQQQQQHHHHQHADDHHHKHQYHHHHHQQQQLFDQQNQQLQFIRQQQPPPPIDRAPDLDRYSMGNQLQDQHQLLLRQQQQQKLQQRQLQEQIRLQQQQQQQHRCQHVGGNRNIDYNHQAQVGNQSYSHQQPQQHKHLNQQGIIHRHDHIDNVLTASASMQQYHGLQHPEHRHHQHTHHHHHPSQHPHLHGHNHNHHHHQHQHQQQALHHNHPQQLAATLDDQHVVGVYQSHDHYHHQHGQRVSQHQDQQRKQHQHQQQYLQNVKVDPRLTAMNR